MKEFAEGRYTSSEKELELERRLGCTNRIGDYRGVPLVGNCPPPRNTVGP